MSVQFSQVSLTWQLWFIENFVLNSHLWKCHAERFSVCQLKCNYFCLSQMQPDKMSCSFSCQRRHCKWALLLWERCQRNFYLLIFFTNPEMRTNLFKMVFLFLYISLYHESECIIKLKLACSMLFLSDCTLSLQNQFFDSFLWIAPAQPTACCRVSLSSHEVSCRKPRK